MSKAFSFTTNMDPAQQPTVAQPLPPAYPGPPGYEVKQPGGYGAAYPQQPGYPTQGQLGYGNVATTTMIVQQPTHVVMGMRFFESPVAMNCTYCQASIITATTYEPGTLTWIACGGVALMG